MYGQCSVCGQAAPLYSYKTMTQQSPPNTNPDPNCFFATCVVQRAMGQHCKAACIRLRMRAMIPRQLSSSMRAQPAKDLIIHVCGASSGINSLRISGVVTTPNKIVGVTTASKRFKCNLIETCLSVSTVQN